MTEQEQTQEMVQNQLETTKKKQQTGKKQPVDKSKYDQYINLKFLEIVGGQLTKESREELVNLETELKKCTGSIPVKTVTAAIGNEIIRMVAGVPLPEEYATIIKGCKKPEHYLG